MIHQEQTNDPKEGPRIISTEGVCGGRPRVRGTRVRVIDVLDMLGAGMDRDEILRDYPYLTKEDIEACVQSDR